LPNQRSSWECTGECGEVKPKEDFSDDAWAQLQRRICKACAREHRKCIGACRDMKTKEDFSEDAWAHPLRRICKDCARKPADKKQCLGSCGEMKAQEDFSDRAWRQPQSRVCKCCAPTPRGFWKCCRCKKSQPKASFATWLAGRKTQANNGTASCNACKSEHEQMVAQVTRDSVGLVCKRKRGDSPKG